MASFAGQTGSGQFRRGAAEGNHDRRAQRGGNVHGAGVVGEQDAAEPERGAKFAKARCAGEIRDSGCVIKFFAAELSFGGLGNFRGHARRKFAI